VLININIRKLEVFVLLNIFLGNDAVNIIHGLLLLSSSINNTTSNQSPNPQQSSTSPTTNNQ
jgi:hypothetical protein